MATLQITIDIGEEPDELPSIVLLGGNADWQITKYGPEGRYAVRITGTGVIPFQVQWLTSTIPKSKDYSVSFVTAPPTANAISAQLANDQLEGENGWDDGPLVTIAANAATAATQGTIAASQSTAAALAASQIPRSANPIAAGAAATVERNKVTATSDRLLETARVV
jgi:hypothetical protein